MILIYKSLHNFLNLLYILFRRLSFKYSKIFFKFFNNSVTFSLYPHCFSFQYKSIKIPQIFIQTFLSSLKLNYNKIFEISLNLFIYFCFKITF